MRDFQGVPNPSPVHRLVETAVFSALVIILSLLSVLLPVAGDVLGLLVLPTIFYIIFRRSGSKWAILALIISTLLSAFVSGPLAIKSFLNQLFPAVIFSFFLIRNYGASWTIFGTTVAYSLGEILWKLIGIWFFKISVSPADLEMQMRSLLANMQLSADFEMKIHSFLAKIQVSADLEAQLLAALRPSADALALAEAMIPMAIKIFYGITVAGIILVSAMSTFIGYKVTKYFVHRLIKVELPDLPSFSVWDFPKWLGVPLAILWVSAWYVGYRELIIPDWMLNIAVFVLYISGTAMLLQGLAVFKYMLRMYRAPQYVFYVLIGISPAIPFILMTAIIMGVADLFVDYRRIRQKRV